MESRVEQLRKKWSLKHIKIVTKDQFTTYRDSLLKKVSNLLTEKLSDEVRQGIHDPIVIDTENRGNFKWSE